MMVISVALYLTKEGKINKVVTKSTKMCAKNYI